MQFKTRMQVTAAKLLSIFVVFACAAGISLGWLSSTVKAAGDPAGTEDDPYIVTTAEQLNNIRLETSAHYKLGGDIDLSSIANWEPIPNFSGSFDGDGHVITNLKIDRAAESNIGLFGKLGWGAKIANVGLHNPNVTGADNVGTLVGDSYRGQITNSYASGVQVHGQTTVGGLIGSASGKVKIGYASGTVNGVENVGGLSGTGGTENDDLQMEYVYADVNVTGTTNVGGLVGQVFMYVQLKHSYAGGTITGENAVGGLVGQADIPNGINNSYYDKDTSGQSDTGKGVPRTTAEMQQQSNYGFWDFNTIWFITENNYPKLRALEPAFTVTYDGNGSTSGTVPDSVKHPGGSSFQVPSNAGQLALDGKMFVGWSLEANGSSPLYMPEESFVMSGHDIVLYAQWIDAMAGSGTEADPYIVMQAVQLDAVRLDRNAHYKLGSDIDLGTYTNNWNPIGTPGMYKSFAGSFDGNGYVIYNLRIEKTTNHIGLFGILESAGKLNHVRLNDVFVSGGSNVGGLVGTNHGTISDSYVTGTVTGSGDVVGGLAGQNDRAEITGSYARGVVSGASYVGGLVGESVGYYPDYPRIENSYARVNVTGTGDYVGGLTSRSTGTVENSYAAGSVTGTGNNVAGLLKNEYGLMNSMYDQELAGTVKITGGATSTANMKKKATYSGWDFDTVWAIKEGSGYPVLRKFGALSYTVMYVGNGSTSGSAPVDTNSYGAGSLVVVMGNTGGLARDGYTFAGWNTAANGTGTTYQPGAGFLTGEEDVTLYAQWLAVPTYTIVPILDQSLSELEEGYAAGTQEMRTISITRSGTAEIANLDVTISGADASHFIVIQPAETTLNAANPSTTFMVKAADHLPAKTYEALLTVSADHMTDVTFKVTQQVKKKPVLKGDATGDGKITAADALLITKYMNNKVTLTPEQFEALDMNEDGVLDQNDVKLIMDIYVGGNQ